MRFLSAAFFLLLLVSDTRAQSLFQKGYGLQGSITELRGAQPTTDGGFLLTGTYSGGSLMVKTAANGDTLWTRKLLTGSAWQAQAVSNGYLLTGNALVRTDLNGQVQWAKTYDGGGAYVARNTTDGGFVFGGWSGDRVIRTNGAGTPIWQCYYEQFQSIEDIQPVVNTGFVVLGTSAGTVGAGLGDVLLMKIDGGGNVEWSRTYGGADNDIGRSVQRTSDGGFVITGYTYSAGAGNADVLLLKVDMNGNLTWARTYGGTLGDEGFSVQQVANTGYIVSGLTWSWGQGNQLYALLANNAGDLIWSHAYGQGFGTSANIAAKVPGGYMLAGTSEARFHLLRTDEFGATGCEYATATIAASPVLTVGSPTIAAVPDLVVEALVTVAANSGLNDLVQPCVATCVAPQAVHVAVKCLLSGPYNSATGLMNDQLRAQGRIPLTHPYAAMAWPVTGPTATSIPVLSVTGANAIIDWVVLELRSAATPAQVIERRACLLQADGDVVDVDGVSPVGFCAPPNNYHVAVRHRNHLAVMTATPWSLAPVAVSIDLTTPATATFGTAARKSVGSALALWPGNARWSDSFLAYTGSANDRDAILTYLGGINPNSVLFGYTHQDLNLDGQIKYTGTANDRDLILQSVGSSTPNYVRLQQLP